MSEEKNPNECDVCHNSDVKTHVRSSKLGERHWKNKNHIKKIRYVDKKRLSEKGDY